MTAATNKPDKTAIGSSDTKVWDELRKPFPAEVIGKLPKGGVQLDYVGHAAITDRLLKVDPTWTWEPLAADVRGLPALDGDGNLWIKLTIAGVTRLGVGDGRNMKERIGDALRNAAMRFGVALDLWSKDELESTLDKPELKNRPTAKPKRITAKEAIAKIYKTLETKGFSDPEDRKSILLRVAHVEDASELTPELIDHVSNLVETLSGKELQGYLEAELSDPNEPDYWEKAA